MTVSYGTGKLQRNGRPVATATVQRTAFQLRARRANTGFTLVELMITTAVCSLILSALVSAAVAIQRCYAAGDDYATAKCDQMRLSDYLALDLRRALTVTPGTDGTTLLVLNIPDYYDANGQPVTPTLTKDVVNYNGSSMKTVVYTKNGSSIYRQEGTGARTEIAANVTDFQVSVQDLNKVVKTQITFAPQFSRKSTQDARTATTVFNTTLLRNKRRDRS